MKTIENILYVLSILFFVWFFVSIFDVNAHNLNGGCTTNWNLFVILVKFGKIFNLV